VVDAIGPPVSGAVGVSRAIDTVMPVRASARPRARVYVSLSVADREELRADSPLLAFRPAACAVLAIPSPTRANQVHFM
jgi:hypothetical protein